MDKKRIATVHRTTKNGIIPLLEKTEWSSSLFQKLEGHPLFLQAHTLLLYHSLPDEVQTHEFIKHWHSYKRIVLPLVKGEELEFRYYEGENSLQAGAFGIEEPTGSLVENLHEIELSIIPGVAFDRSGNRLGLGKRILRPRFDQAAILSHRSVFSIPTASTYSRRSHRPAHGRSMDGTRLRIQRNTMFTIT